MIIDASKKEGQWIATGAILACTACSMAMNFKFGQTLSDDMFEKWIWSMFGLSLDLLKVFGLAFAAAAWSKGHKLKASAAFVVWLACVLYASTAAIGFAAHSRDSTTASRMTDAKDAARDIADYDRLSGEIDTIKKSKLFDGTAACTHPTEKDSISYCQKYYAKAAELDRLRSVVRGAKIEAADPQIAQFQYMSGVAPEKIKTAIVVFVAAVSEIISSLGMFAVSKSIAKAMPRMPADRVRKPRLVASAGH